MAQLAIKGHETRGKEVIEILEMLGGKNVANYDGSNTKSFYFLNNIIICSRYGSGKLLGIDCYALEEFLEKFPYKIGDKVTHSDYESPLEIVGMKLEDDSIKYEVYTNDYGYWFIVDELQPYKEETMREIKIDIPNGYEFAVVDDDNKIVLTKKEPQYPKTYEECAKELGYNQVMPTDHILGYKGTLLSFFQQLLICRDAYWKIAGEQMGLGKPWKQDYNDRCFIIANNNGNIHTYEYHGSGNVILAFPTEEMRDVFYENFKELINQCKELL